ncbi:sterile alpha motif domain-containing protein 1 [Euwallacea fornicatus]|uniref:sterile alpha motif domain-containing protein 1 n=1 Tax=Euwallacea fornicatus TaxID=995702 RepID=UPI00338E311C
MNNAPTSRNRERILEAIDQLRKRKARPDVTRICNYLFRRFHVNSSEAKADLEWCVANNIVLKVEYKGNISYRNAAKKWAQMRHREARGYSAGNLRAISKSAFNSQKFMELLTNVFGELVMEEPDYLEVGVPSKEIMDNILAKDSAKYTRSYIAILLVREVERGNLIKLENGNYLLGPCTADKQQWMPKAADSTEQKSYPPILPKRNYNTENGSASDNFSADVERDRHSHAAIKPKRRMIAKMQAAQRQQEKLSMKKEAIDSGDDKPSDNGNVRLGGRRKKAKKVFDPSDTHVPKKRGRPLGSLNKATMDKQNGHSRRDEESRPDSRSSTGSRDHGGVCSVCHNQSKKGLNDRMVACRECSNKAHYACLNGDDMMLKMYPDNTWQCPHCKTCVVCYETSDAGNLIVCSVCADGYHASCHQPRITDKIRDGQRWLCVNCHVTDELKLNDIQSNIGDDPIGVPPLGISHTITINKDNVIKGTSSHSNSSGIPSPYDSPSRSTTPSDSSRRGKNQSESPEQEGESDSNSGKESDQEDHDIDPSIPDATHWTPDDVYEYFAQYFPEEAKVFKEQEIDGRSLLLLKRLDVLTNLNLKLGPALKIYRHVTMLQVRRDDRRLYWL